MTIFVSFPGKKQVENAKKVEWELKEIKEKLKQQEAEVELMRRQLEIHEGVNDRLIREKMEEKEKYKQSIEKFMAERQKAVEAKVAAEKAHSKAECRVIEEKECAEKAEMDKEKAVKELMSDPVVLMKRQMELVESMLESTAKKPKMDEKSEFTYKGFIKEQPEGHVGWDYEGIRHLRKVKISARNKIANYEYIRLTDLTEASTSDSLGRKAEMNSKEYLNQNVPPPKKLKTKLEVFEQLILFACYFLQKYPEKTGSFLDYLLYLFDHCHRLTVEGIIELDHRVREEFCANPDWNWSQTRPETDITARGVLDDDRYRIKNHDNHNKHSGGKGKASTSGRWSGFKSSSRGGRGGG